jgi:catalase
MGYSPDKMLQGRLISYPDAYRYSLGVNYDSLPVNRARCPAHTYHRDGSMRFDENGGEMPNYEPNSFGGPKEDRRFVESPYKIDGDAGRYDHREGNDDYQQAGDLFRLLSPTDKDHLIHNIALAMKGVPEVIIKLQLTHFATADPDYGSRVAEALGVAMEATTTA